VFVYNRDRLGGVNDVDAFRPPPRFREKTLPNALMVSEVAALHTIRGLFPSRERYFNGHIQHQGQVRLQPSRRQAAHFPQQVRIESSCVTLIDDVRQEVTVRKDDPTGIEGRPDNGCGELRSAGHEEQRLTRQRHLMAVVKEEISNDVANRGAAGIGALDHGMPLRAEPLGEHAALGGFPCTVESIEGDERNPYHQINAMVSRLCNATPSYTRNASHLQRKSF
jgi:hypothetical protein